MSAIIVLPVILPAAAAAWPAVAAAAAAAAGALGFAAAGASTDAQAESEVEVPMENSEAVTEGLALGEELVFTRGDVQVTVGRDARGKVSVKVRGCAHAEAELREIGQELTNKLAQQYAYHRLMTELKQRNFTVVGEQVEDDGTVRVQVRTFQG